MFYISSILLNPAEDLYNFRRKSFSAYFWFRLMAFWFLPRFYCKSSDKAGTVFVAPCWMILPHSTHDHISRQRYSVEIESILLMVV
jgi:hypothetical protein